MTMKKISSFAIGLSICLAGGAGLVSCCNDSETVTPVEALQKIPDFTVQIKSVTRANNKVSGPEPAAKGSHE